MKNKGLIIVVVLLLIYGIIMFIMFGNKENVKDLIEDSTSSSESQKINYYLVLDDRSYRFDDENNKLYRISNYIIEDLDSLNVYVNNNYYGNYSMRYVAKWNLLDEKKEFVKYSGGLIAGSQSLKLNVRNIKIREINDQDKIFLINKYNLASFNYLTTNEAVDIDLDNNGVMDEIICLSSKEYSNNANNYYNLVVVKFNDNIYEIINEQGDNANVYNIESVFNILNKSEDMIYINKSVGAQSEDPAYENIVIKYVNNNYSID